LSPVFLPGLRYRRLWICLGVLLFCGVAIACLMPGEDLPRIGGSDKFKHALSFGLLAFWFGSIVARTHLPWVGIAVLAFGGLIELLQGAMGWGRDAEWLDMWANLLGVTVGLALVLSPVGRWPRWCEGLVAKAVS
jgi:hypothetical protein